MFHDLLFVLSSGLRTEFLNLKMEQIVCHQYLTLKIGQTVSPETLVFNLNQTPGNYPKEDN